MALSFYATMLTIKLTVSGIVDPSGCSFNDLISCDAVLATSYAKFLGVPVSLWGMLFYIWTFFTLLFAAVKSRSEFGGSCAEAAIFVSSFSVLVTIFKIYQLISLKAVCPVCVGMYICNFTIFFLLLISLGIRLAEYPGYFLEYSKSIFKKVRKENATHPMRFGIIFVWVFAMGYLGMKYYENTVISPGMKSIRSILDEHYKQEQVVINTEGSPETGNSDASVRLVEFSDFQCPACKLLAENLKPILLEYKDEISLSFMNYPLDQSINPNVKHDFHKEAGLAALAGVCAQKHNKFWEYQSKVFENQSEISRDYLIQLASELGLAREEFVSCLDSDETRQQVLRDIETAINLNIGVTPTLFINGRMLKYWNSPEIIRSVIEEELRSKK